MIRGAAVAAGLAVDRVVGEPPEGVHPVAGFAASMSRLEQVLWGDSRARGVVHAVCGVAGAAMAGRALGGRALRSPAVAGGHWRGRPLVTTAASTWLTAAGRMLADEARSVEAALVAGDLGTARHRVSRIVGRRTTDLDAFGVARAAVETVAENTVDAVVAPALWSLVGGPAGAFGYRAVNTLDAMVGHRTPRYGRFGWAAAKADDAANWVPARVTAVLVAAVRPRSAGAVLRAVAEQAPHHPSPNAGVAEAAFAAALGLRLGGPNVYGDVVDERPVLGAGRLPVAADISQACRLSSDVTTLLGALTITFPVLAARVGGRRGSCGR